MAALRADEDACTCARAQVPGGVGEQQESGRSASPRVTFGSCTRDRVAKVGPLLVLAHAIRGPRQP